MSTSSHAPTTPAAEQRTERPSYLALATLVADSAERERAIFEAAWAAGYRTGGEAGRQIGREQADAQIEAAQARLHRDLVGRVIDLDAATRARRELTIAALCREPGCETRVTVPHRTALQAVRCLPHQPLSKCDGHRERDRCAYQDALGLLLRPEYTGGPVPVW